MKVLTEVEQNVTDETRDFFLTKVNSQGFDSITTSPNF
jgi:hypothetical protein